MITTVIGIGLIGGSLSLELRSRKISSKIIGVDINIENQAKALSLNLVDEIGNIQEACKISDLVIIAVPIDKSENVLITVLDVIPDKTVVIDVGSTKKNICQIAEKHPKRSQFVAAHPIAGTEFSGPESAHLGLFEDKVNIVCDPEKSDTAMLDKMIQLFSHLGMNTIYMNAEDHDKHIAYVSHISHISSFALGLTVLEIEKNRENIYQMAGGGFESTVRLAKSSADMWTPIFVHNADNILVALQAYIDNLNKFKRVIEGRKDEEINSLIIQANKISKALKET